jgi:hypothetical protein
MREVNHNLGVIISREATKNKPAKTGFKTTSLLTKFHFIQIIRFRDKKHQKNSFIYKLRLIKRTAFQLSTTTVSTIIFRFPTLATFPLINQ